MTDTLAAARARFHARVNAEHAARDQKAFQTRFARMVRTSDFQLNVMRQWPRTVKW